MKSHCRQCSCCNLKLYPNKKAFCVILIVLGFSATCSEEHYKMLINNLYLKLFLKSHLRRLHLDNFCCIIYEHCNLGAIKMSLPLFFPSESIKKKKPKTLIKPLKFSSYTGKILSFNVSIAFSS